MCPHVTLKLLQNNTEMQGFGRKRRQCYTDVFIVLGDRLLMQPVPV